MKTHNTVLSGQYMGSTFCSKRWYGPNRLLFHLCNDEPSWLDSRSLILDGNKMTKIEQLSVRYPRLRLFQESWKETALSGDTALNLSFDFGMFWLRILYFNDAEN